MNKQFTPDPCTRADTRRQKKMKKQLKGNSERAAMEKRAQAKISFGTWTIFGPPKPNSKISDFTVAFPRSLKRSDLYRVLAEALGDSWGSTRSIRIVLSDPPAWEVTRKNVRDALETLLIDTASKASRDQ